MKTILTGLALVALAAWLWLVASLATPPAREYVWTVSPATAPPSEVVQKGSERPAGCLVVWLF